MAAIFVTAFSLFYVAKANPSFFMRQNNGVTTTATTSVSYMSPGAATTTAYIDTGLGAGSTDTATLAVQFNGSSTASIINVNYEFSQGGNGQDCINVPASCDWYQSNLEASTTGSVVLVNQPQSISWAFASSSQGGANVLSTNRALKLLKVLTPTRYVRAIVTVPAGAGNSAVWTEFIAKRQAN